MKQRLYGPQSQKYLQSGPLQNLAYSCPRIMYSQLGDIGHITLLSLSVSPLDSGDNNGISFYRILVRNKWNNPYKLAHSRCLVSISVSFRTFKTSLIFFLFHFLLFLICFKKLIKSEHSLALIEALSFQITLG